jgi:hypothetical protein
LGSHWVGVESSKNLIAVEDIQKSLLVMRYQMARKVKSKTVWSDTILRLLGLALNRNDQSGDTLIYIFAWEKIALHVGANQKEQKCELRDVIHSFTYPLHILNFPEVHILARNQKFLNK